MHTRLVDKSTALGHVQRASSVQVFHNMFRQSWFDEQRTIGDISRAVAVDVHLKLAIAIA